MENDKERKKRKMEEWNRVKNRIKSERRGRREC